MTRPRLHTFLSDLGGMIGGAWRWFVTPSSDPINRVCSLLAGGAVALVAVTVAYVEWAR